MSFKGTDKQKLYKLQALVKDKDILYKNQMKGFRKHLISINAFPITTCTQCKRGMSKQLGKLQEENKRENAPICIPCIEGKTRRLLTIIERNK